MCICSCIALRQMTMAKLTFTRNCIWGATTVSFYATTALRCVIITNSVYGGLGWAAPRRGRTEQHRPAPHTGPLLCIPTSSMRLLDKGKEWWCTSTLGASTRLDKADVGRKANIEKPTWNVCQEDNLYSFKLLGTLCCYFPWWARLKTLKWQKLTTLNREMFSLLE